MAPTSCGDFFRLVSKPARRALQGMLCAGFSREHSIRYEDGEAERQKQGVVVVQVDPADDKENGDYMEPWDHLVAVRRPEKDPETACHHSKKHLLLIR